MNRIERLNAILTHLQSKQVVTAQEIANRFKISIRTVYRDIRALEEAGVPLGAEAGIGYFLPDNYQLPPVMFTNEEASALLFGSKFIEQTCDARTKKAIESALFKIKAVLKSKEKQYIENLENHIAVFQHTNLNKPEQNSFLYIIQKSIIEKIVLQIEYYTNYSDSISTRKVEPLGMIYYAGNWHLIAYCLNRKDYRDFRVDRISHLNQTNEHFTEKSQITLNQYFEKTKSVEGMYKISLIVKKESLKFIQDSKYWYGYTCDEEFDEANVRMFFYNADLFGFSRWVVLGSSNVRVEYPGELKTMVNKLAQDIGNHTF